jgi:hypothetical protein
LTARTTRCEWCRSPFEVQHRVDDVLERLGPARLPSFGDVADEERRDVLALRREQQLRRRLAHLPMLPGADWNFSENTSARIDDARAPA